MASILNERYEVIERRTVNEGDFTHISFKARVLSKSSDSSDGRIVILNLLPREADTQSVMAAAEKAASIPPSPNILKLFGFTEMVGKPDVPDGIYLVSEYARGISLRERIRRVAPFSLPVSLDIAIAICQGILQGEFVGVSHNALKPDYIILTPDGLVKVGEFQVAAAVLEAQGDIAFCRDDRRSVGLLLYEMLTGVAPDQLVIVDEQSPRQINSNVPSALDGIVRKSTSLDSNKQYTDVSRILADLQTAREDLRAGKPLNWSPSGIASSPLSPRAGTRTPNPSSSAAPRRTESPMKPSRTERTTDQYDDIEYPVWGKVLLGVLGLVVLGLVFAGAYLFTILSVPTDVVVPNLIGKQFADAQKIAADDHFTLVKTQDDFSDILPTGSIYQMSPTPGRTIKAGKEVDVSVSDGPRQVTVPDLSDMTPQKAAEALNAVGLPQGSATSDFSETVPKGIVASQQPPAGASIAHDTPVNFVISKGQPTPAAPSGLAATSTVDGEIDLTWNDDPDAITYDVYRDGIKVQSGLPQAAYSDVNLGPGESHSYTVTGVNENGESPQSAAVRATTIVDNADNSTPDSTDTTDTTDNTTTVAAPGAPKERKFEIKFNVPDNGPHNCQIEVQDTTGTNIVYDQDRNGGDTVDDSIIGFGNKIIFRIFIDGKLIRQDTK